MNLDKKIKITDYITLIALVLTLIAAVFAFYFKNQQAILLNAQRQQDLLEIAKANESSALARRDSEKAKKDAATAFEKAASSNEKAAKAELKSKELEMELLQLRLAVSDRFLPDFVKESLTNKLKYYQGIRVLIICNISNNTEPMNFSIELKNFLIGIGWNTEVKNNQNVMIPPPTGIKIYTNGETNLTIAKLIKEEFANINYPCDIIKTNDFNESILIQVNSK
ncbi:hypothetical protein [Sediminibacterium sp.]|uniref:hypothetical protein n=1 Tax=Sediminibacterium sp. TaxID=1917865 RepID=UPI003F70AD57